MAAGQITGLLALGEQRRRFIDGGRALVGGGIHGSSPKMAVVLVSSSREVARKHALYAFPWMACQTRSGVAGISRLLLPIASVMALMTAADEPIAPASPQPFTPSGLPGHSVVVWESLNDGRPSARVRGCSLDGPGAPGRGRHSIPHR
jgi:hypothetical protein